MANCNHLFFYEYIINVKIYNQPVPTTASVLFNKLTRISPNERGLTSFKYEHRHISCDTHDM